MLNKRNLPKFKPDIYTKITLNELVVYAISYFQKDGREMTTEDIISACFLLFPQRFALHNYPEWPDAAIVSRHWNECRVKGYIRGSAAKGFKLTAKGSSLAEKVEKDLGATMKPGLVERVREFVRAITPEPVRVEEKQVIQTPKADVITDVKKSPTIQSHSPQGVAEQESKTRVPSRVKKTPPQKEAHIKLDEAHPTTIKVSKEAKARATKFVHLMERSDAYDHYKKNGHNSNISEFDFRSLLLCTMESSAETLAKNVKLFKGYADIQNRQDLLTFLNYCEGKFSHLLASQKKHSKPAMQKQRR